MARNLSSALLILLALGAELARADAPFRFPEDRRGKGELRYINGLPVLQVEGTPEEIGDQVACLALKPGKRALGYPRDSLEAHASLSTWPLLIQAGKGLLARFPAEYRQELDAMARPGLDRDALIAGNTMFDIKRLFACSGLIVGAERSATGGPLLARNLDYPSLGYIHQYSLITVYRPARKHAFAAVGFPGLVGCVSGMNDAGLALAVHEVCTIKDSAERFDPQGLPYAICNRRILEECTTVEEAEKLLRSMKRTTIINLAICDRKGGAVFEITPKEIVVRRSEDGLCTCTNHFCTNELQVKDQQNQFGTLRRLATLEKARKEPRLDLDAIRKSLHAVCQADHTLQTMVFEPASLKLHLAVGACPSSALPLREIDLTPLLTRTGTRP